MIDKGEFTFEEFERDVGVVVWTPEPDVCLVGGASDGRKREVRHGRCQRTSIIGKLE